MAGKLDTTSNAAVEEAVRQIMRSFDNAIDVKEAIRGHVETVWNVALATGVKSGVDSVHAGTFDAAVRGAVRDLRSSC